VRCIPPPPFWSCTQLAVVPTCQSLIPDDLGSSRQSNVFHDILSASMNELDEAQAYMYSSKFCAGEHGGLMASTVGKSLYSQKVFPM